MRTCPECGISFEGTGSFCPNCGKYMPYQENPEAVHCEPEAANYSAPGQNFVTPQNENPEMQSAQMYQNAPSGFNPPAGENTKFESLLTPSIGSCILTFFLSSLPLIGFIYVLCLACGATKYAAKKNFARAFFIWIFILLVIESAALIAWVFFLSDKVNIAYVQRVLEQIKGFIPFM